MRSKKGVLAGPKISSNHSTLIEAAIPIVVAAKSLPEVSKVVLSEIVPIGPGTQRIKFAPIPAGLRITIRGATARQTFYVYSTDPALTQRTLQDVWNGAH